MTDDLQTILIISAVACGLLGAAIGSSKGQAGAGLVLGALLGLIGVIIVAVMKPTAEYAAQTTSALPVRPGGWWPDPYGRHAKRYYSGTDWTNHIIDAHGNQGIENLQ